MKNTVIVILALALTACGAKEQQVSVTGNPGLDGISMGIDISPLAATCLAGGSTIRTFVDTNRDGNLDGDETIKKIGVICNGLNGLNGIDGTSTQVSIASAAQCPAGGILVTSGTLTYPVCNGSNGTMGPQGLAGLSGPSGIPGKSAYEIWLDKGNTGDEDAFLASLQGTDGTNGTDGVNGLSAYELWLSLGNVGTVTQFLATLTGPAGSNGTDGVAGDSAYQTWLNLGNTGTEAQFIASLKGATGSTGAVGPQGPQASGGVGNLTPVQLCPGDTGVYKEMGFIVGSDLYAVYFDKTQPIAFLAKLSPGNYVTTNGSNCSFTYANSNGQITLSNSVGTISPPSSGPCNAGIGNGNGNGCNNNGNGH